MHITKLIEYIPDLNNSSDEQTLLKLYKQKYENICSKKYGYIITVNQVSKIIEKKISIYNGYVIANCIIDVDCLIPMVGTVFKGIVKQIFPQGMIVIVKNCMKVFIPKDDRYVTKKQEDIVEVRIEQMRFQKGKYDCIGVLVA